MWAFRDRQATLCTPKRGGVPLCNPRWARVVPTGLVAIKGFVVAGRWEDHPGSRTCTLPIPMWWRPGRWRLCALALTLALCATLVSSATTCAPGSERATVEALSNCVACPSGYYSVGGTEWCVPCGPSFQFAPCPSNATFSFCGSVGLPLTWERYADSSGVEGFDRCGGCALVLGTGCGPHAWRNNTNQHWLAWLHCSHSLGGPPRAVN